MSEPSERAKAWAERETLQSVRDAIKARIAGGYDAGAAAERAAAAERERLWLGLYEAANQVVIEAVAIGPPSLGSINTLNAALAALREAGMVTP